MLEKENKINIHLFGNTYIGSNITEFYVYELTERKNKDGELEEQKIKIGHYSCIKALFNNLVNLYLRHYSNAKNFEELISDINFVKKLLNNLQIDM